ncbi:hypothetical protein M501DRAFT_937240 [Patellaria atrata CBS 101060]|uniref:Uncharacterized protein n=1 Tax=Patellaria atrata CBS 101060 TaxID=1346257 RepID=A0A9P4S7N7_9PEZI|nr:hypothetical protein M501DRAFT_937240 [Patellaria atrata CBS 101060]
MPLPLGQTITVVNKSGKVVSTSKHLVNVFKEAKSAYRERKAEIQAARDAEIEQKRTQRAFKAMTIQDDDDDNRSRTSRRSKSHRDPTRPPMERGYSDSFYANDPPSPRRANTDPRARHKSPLYQEQKFDVAGETRRGELVRRNTDDPRISNQSVDRRGSEQYIDMDLAYGDLPPPLPTSNYEEEAELRNKVSRLQQMLDEANCLHHSVTAMVDNLQKNPDALAAVALTLAEISNIVTKMSPAVLTSLKGSFPAVIALLASPQFMIAGGVAVGVTIVALGGFKVIKKIQAHKKEEEERVLEEPLEMDQLQERELSRIELWRRGIADAAAESEGSTVDGEFITPGASRHLIDVGVLDKGDMKSSRGGRSRRRSADDAKSKAPKPPKSEKSSKSTSRSKSEKSRTGVKVIKRHKEPSGLRMLFT